jgi:two-component system copper resistance phosphate regulon response regulator CusR
MKLLLVEDSTRLRKNLTIALQKSGHVVDACETGTDGLMMLQSHTYDVLILDIMLPGIDGLGILKRLRDKRDATPVLLLTARDSIEDKVIGLSTGADDYLIKPFSLAELEARLVALNRRRHGHCQSRISAGPLEIDTAAKSITREGKSIPLTNREYALLEFLALRPGRVFNREQIEAAIYQDSINPASNAVDSAICQLRRKISLPDEPPIIHTRRGLGYVFMPP